MRQYEMFELTLKGNAPEGSETAASFQAEFTLNGKTAAVKGFYAGEETYKVRFYPMEAGVCSWKITCPPKMSDQVQGKEQLLTGEEECLPASLDVHGMVRTAGIHFRYEDGRAYYPFGTTVYALLHQKKELIEETFQSLEKAPFNKIRFCIFPKHYCFNNNEPDYFAFERTETGFDFNKPCYVYWEALDQTLDRLDGLGMQADIILFHSYDHWGFAKMTKEECFLYLDYLIRRLSAHPNVWWSLANEYDLMHEFEPERWPEMAAFIGKEDQFHHLLSNHQWVTQWDFANPDTTHVCMQGSNAQMIQVFQKKYGKPVMYDEMGYEGNIPYGWGNLSGFELVNRFWKVVAGSGYGAHGETFCESMDDDQILWWSKGGILKGESPKRIGFLREIIESFPGPLSMQEERQEHPFETQEDLKRLIEAGIPGIADWEVMIALSKLDDDRFRAIKSALIQSYACYEDKVFLNYYGDMCTIIGTMTLPEEGSYRVEIIDAWEMTRTVAMEHVNGKIEVRLPGKRGIALLATKECE